MTRASLILGLKSLNRLESSRQLFTPKPRQPGPLLIAQSEWRESRKGTGKLEEDIEKMMEPVCLVMGLDVSD